MGAGAGSVGGCLQTSSASSGHVNVHHQPMASFGQTDHAVGVRKRYPQEDCRYTNGNQVLKEQFKIDLDGGDNRVVN